MARPAVERLVESRLRGRRRPLVRRSLRRGDDALAAVYGGAVATNGAGGIAYHGPGGPVGLWVHDVALISTMATMATVNIQELARGRRTAAPALAVTAVAGAVIAVAPQLSRRIQNIGVGLIAATEMLRAATPSRRPTSIGAQPDAGPRTGCRWCRPCRQPHRRTLVRPGRRYPGPRRLARVVRRACCGGGGSTAPEPGSTTWRTYGCVEARRLVRRAVARA